MDDQKRQIVDKLQASKNVLVTVSANPSVDQLAACIALTLVLNKLDKHATAVYSGSTPSTIDFLKPADTLETNTNSLRDFIISLDKTKADKLRYKVEEKVVKIFITPYRTSLSGKDLEFSQGDFNVDVVVGIGVHHQQDLDTAITANGRILHDAAVVTINNTPDTDLGNIHWQDLSASSVSELVASLVTDLGKEVLDTQIATALLTGIVAETERFSNSKTSPRTMSLSAELMAAGANQQLVAVQLEQKPKESEQKGGKAAKAQNDTKQNEADQSAAPGAADNSGTLEIDHNAEGGQAGPQLPPAPALPAPANPAPAPGGNASLDSFFKDLSAPTPPNQINDIKSEGASADRNMPAPKLVTEPPQRGGMLTANTSPEQLDPSTDPMSMPTPNTPLLSRTPNLSAAPPVPPVMPASSSATPPSPFIQPNSVFAPTSPQGPTSLPPASPFVPAASPSPFVPPTPISSTPMPQASSTSQPSVNPAAFNNTTLSEIEQQVHHEEAKPTDANKPATGGEEAGVDSARKAVEDALSSAAPGPMPPIDSLGAQGLVDVPHDLPAQPQQPPVNSPAALAPPQMPGAAAPFVPSPAFAPPQNAASYNEPAPLAGSPADQPQTMPLPPSISMPPVNPVPPSSSATPMPQAPPPVPPPMMPPGGFVNPNNPPTQQ
jgi:hypothetical protein